MNWRETRDFLSMCLPSSVHRALDQVAEGELTEIRVRVGQPVCLRLGSAYKALTITPSADQVAQWAEALCEHALYARAEESRQGFVTLRGGHRMGLCGRVLMQGMSVRSLREISSLCIRIAGQWLGTGDCLMSRLTDSSGRVKNLLVIGAPGSGKTTLLRDCCRQLSNQGLRMCVADERSELAAMCHGTAQLDVGASTDVLDGCPKETALRWLLRSMSPDCLVTDELGSHMDAQAVLEAAQSGVGILASAHGYEAERAMSRSAMYLLRQNQVFAYYALMDEQKPGRLKALYDEAMNPVSLDA